MPSLAKDVQLSLGVLSTVVRVESALVKQDDDLNQICIGSEDAPHDPARVTQKLICEHDHEIDRGKLIRGKSVGEGTFVLLDEFDMATLSEDAEPHKGKIVLHPHPRKDVLATTRWGDKAYYLTPQHGADGYDLLLKIATRSDVILVARYTLRTAVSTFVLAVHEGLLLIREIVAEPMREAPVTLAPPKIDKAMLAVANQFVDVQLRPFNAAEYAGDRKAKLEALIASKEPVVVTGGPVSSSATPAVPQGNLLAALQAQIDAANKPKRKRAPRKAAS